MRTGAGWARVATVAAALWAIPAAAQESFVAEVNALFAHIAPAKRSDTILLPAVAAMEPPPAAVSQPHDARLLPATSRNWPQAEAWVMAAPQRAVLDAINTVTADEDWRTAMAFGQPYGVAQIPPALVRARLYTELGDPPLLAAADHLYLPALDRVASLVHVEATRLAQAELPDQAIDLLIDWTFFCRQMADRAFFQEVQWAMLAMIDALERIRDVAYQDLHRSSPRLTPSTLAGALDRLAEPRGYLGIDRMRLPAGELIAARQLVAMTFEPRGNVNRPAMVSLMSRIASREHPLQRFGERAAWEALAGVHAGRLEVLDQVNGAYNDVLDRWGREWFDPRMRDPLDLEQLDPTRFALVFAVYARHGEPLAVLLTDKQRLRAEAAGTRTALAVVAYRLANGALPPSLAALRPRFVPEVDTDPYNPERERGARPPMEYFVPWKINYRALERGEQPTPHMIEIIVGADLPFIVPIGSDEFVVYSRGPDAEKSWARRVENDSRSNIGGDYLIWPPVLSLHRRHRLQEGLLD